jgi:carboxypeptidase T
LHEEGIQMTLFSVHIIARTLEKLRALEEYDLDLIYRAARQLAPDSSIVPGILTDEQIQQVEDAGYIVKVISDLSQVAVERIKEVSRVNRFAEARGLFEFTERAVKGYMSPEEIESALINLQTLHPDLVTLIELPHRTWENRISHAVRVRAGMKTDRVGVLFTGSMHAREWGGSDICMNFLVNLINAYLTNNGLIYGGKSFSASQIRTILENIDLFVFPDVNPDGKNYSQNYDPSSDKDQDFWWRKNRNPNTTVDPSNPGVDLNRNFDFLWNSGIHAYSNPGSSNYKGESAFSEPETQNVRHLFDTYQNICYFVDIHSYTGLILYSWGDDNNQTTNPEQNFLNPVYDGKRGILGDTLYREFISSLDQNTAEGLATRMNEALTTVRGQGYTVQQAVGLYPTSGASDDYAFSRHIADGLNRKVYAFTIEFGTVEFVPPFSEMSNIIKEVCAAMSELCWAINSDIYVRDNPADTGEVPSSVPFWNSPDIWVRNSDDNDTDHQDTIRGSDNFVYVRVNNRGPAEALNVKVRVYFTNFAGTEFLYPKDWIPQNSAGESTVSGPGTYLIGEAQIPKLAPGASQQVRVLWASSLIPPALNWHPCLLVEVSPNDGLLISGNNVWHKNNLGQKNITIINALRGEIVDFPFIIGSRFNLGPSGDFILEKVQAPRSLGIYLDVMDPEVLKVLKPLISSTYSTGNKPDVESLQDSLVATLQQSTTISIPLGQWLENDDESLILHLPANTRLEIQNSHVEHLISPHYRPLISGFELVTLKHGSVLSLLASKGKIRLPLSAGQMRRMSIRVAIPSTASLGDKYELQAVQYDKKGNAVGGIALEVNVIG